MNKVSVMMPAYNAERFIAQALESVLFQDYSNLEIVVCDDASTDATPDIISRFAEKYPQRIKAIINPRNLGVTKNCNLALSHCDGAYVALFAGDDIMLPGKISKQVALMDKHEQAVMCYHPVEIFDSDSDKTLFITNQTPREDVHNFDDMLLKGGIPGGCSIMLRRSAVPAGGYDESLGTVSDWLFFLEVSLQGQIIKCPEVLARYRKHLGGASQKTYELLNESLVALDVLVTKHPELEQKRNVIDRAKARYLAGEAFRQLETGGIHAYSIARQVLVLDAAPKYKILYVVAWFCEKVPLFSPVLKWTLGKMKVMLKRSLG